MNYIIQKETDDLIIIHKDNTSDGLVLIICGVFVLFVKNSYDVFPIFILIAGFFFLWGFFKLADSESVTVDGKYQIVSINKKSISFLNLKEIEKWKINEFWEVGITTIYGESTCIYSTHNKLDAKRIAEKIGKITNTEVHALVGRTSDLY